MSSLDRTVGLLAATQHGLFSRSQAIEAGATRDQIGWRLRARRWIVHRPGVLAIAGVPATWEQRLMGCCLATRASASHRSSGVLWSVPGLHRSVLEVTVEHGRRVQVDGLIVHQSLDLDRVEPVLRLGIPCLPLDRTVLDLGAVLDPATYGAVVREVIRTETLSWLQLHEVLVRHSRRGRDGCGRLRTILEEEQGLVPTMSSFEHLMEQLLLANGLPRPVRQYEVLDDSGRLIGRVDLCYPAHRLVIEADSWEFHSTRDQFVLDRRRQNRLMLAGWTVLRFTWMQLVREGWSIARDVRSALGR